MHVDLWRKSQSYGGLLADVVVEPLERRAPRHVPHKTGANKVLEMRNGLPHARQQGHGHIELGPPGEAVDAIVEKQLGRLRRIGASLDQRLPQRQPHIAFMIGEAIGPEQLEIV